jgi:hypothetical protein
VNRFIDMKSGEIEDTSTGNQFNTLGELAPTLTIPDDKLGLQVYYNFQAKELIFNPTANQFQVDSLTTDLNKDDCHGYYIINYSPDGKYAVCEEARRGYSGLHVYDVNDGKKLLIGQILP